jgi:hypothetical protein
VLATPTASGKTLVYALSTLRAALADPRARALYLFPLKALSQDQRRGLESDIGALGRVDLRAEVYDGDTAPRAGARCARPAAGPDHRRPTCSTRASCRTTASGSRSSPTSRSWWSTSCTPTAVCSARTWRR